MKFFKHFTDAHRGQSMQMIRQKSGMAGVGRWWTLTEMCAEKLEKDASEEYGEMHCIFTFELSRLANELGTKPGRTEDVLRMFSELKLINYERLENIFKITFPKLLESLDRDSRRARQERGHGAPVPRLRERERERERERDTAVEKSTSDTASESALVEFKDEGELVNMMPLPTKQRWVQLYPDQEFLRRETIKAFEYYERNPRKRPKTIRGWAQAMSSWFERGWKWHVKDIPSNKKTHIGFVKD